MSTSCVFVKLLLVLTSFLANQLPRVQVLPTPRVHSAMLIETIPEQPESEVGLVKKLLLIAAIALVTSIAALAGYSRLPIGEIPPVGEPAFAPVTRSMKPFRSEAELRAFLKDLAEKQKRAARRREVQNQAATGLFSTAAPEASVAKSDSKDESVTNVQHAGVDEGGIVKVHGDYLVILRRGRLFTVAIGDGELKPISAVDAYAPEINPTSTWYDEMLVSGDTVAVIGYSYERGGTEIGLFDINDAGRLRYRSTHHMRSNDYYSSRNYASRLIGNKLIFYTPLYLSPDAEDPFEDFPAVRRWRKGATAGEFRRIAPATRVYRPERPINSIYGLTLHTVTTCDLSTDAFNCEATGVIGPSGRVFYVSPDSVYVWVSDWARRGKQMKAESTLYRMPLDGSSPGALQVSGSPVDQFSFLQSNDDHLNVLVRSNSAGDGMWRAEAASGDVALMRVPLNSFSDGSEAVPASSYQSLPRPEGYTFQNRFVGDYLLYGTGSGWGYPDKKTSVELFTVPWAGGEPSTLSLVHGIDRIEALRQDAVVIGTDGKDLHFTSVRLDESPSLGDTFTRKGASQGELRSHGFFYNADGPESGTIGLPISLPGRPGYRHLFEASAGILFLRNDSLRFSKVGELVADSGRAVDDRCRASCVDWYGNARPLFVRGRVLALLGYEIVEGALGDGRLLELRRVNYQGQTAAAVGRGSQEQSAGAVGRGSQEQSAGAVGSKNRTRNPELLLPSAFCRLPSAFCLLPSALPSAPAACYNLRPMDWQHLPTIHTDRLSLRAISNSDLDDIYEIFSDPEVMRYWSTPPLPHKQAASDLITEIHESFQRRISLKWGITLPSENVLIGTATLFQPDFTNHRVELGYALGRKYWGRGYMCEALNAVLNYAFAELEMHRIEADVDPRNASSVRMLERLGFQREGYLRERWQVNGEIQDALFYGLLRPDWKGLNASSP